MVKFLRSNWQWLLIIMFSLFTALPLFSPGYFSHHDDLQVIRIFEMRKCFEDLQLPCRWVPDMGYGNGYPLFNYYSAAPYYLGAVLSYVFGYIGAAKVLFFIPLLLGGIGMYMLGKELFGKYGGLVSAVLYIFVPYRALDTYVRGAVAENFALGILPFIFFFSYKLIKERKFPYALGLISSLFILFTSHNIMTMLTIPLLLLWIGFFLVRNNFSPLKGVVFSLGTAFGLSAFFVVPAFFEKNLVTTQSLTQGHLNYQIHFVSLSQLIERSWGYGSSVTGVQDGMSFQVGWPHLAMAPVVLVLLLLLFKKIRDEKKYILLFLLGLFGIALFMTHGKSWFIWENVPLMAYVQFPWRFLGYAAFASSLLGGGLMYLLSFYTKSAKLKFIIVSILTGLTVALNFSYFKPGTVYPGLTDSEKLSGKLWEEQQKGAVLDYLPTTASGPREPAPALPIIRKGRAEVGSFGVKSNWWETDLTVKEAATIEIPVLDFPNWQVRVGEELIPHQPIVIGRITFDLPAGRYKVTGEFHNTPIRTFSNGLSLVSLLGLVIVLIYAQARKVFI